MDKGEIMKTIYKRMLVNDVRVQETAGHRMSEFTIYQCLLANYTRADEAVG